MSDDVEDGPFVSDPFVLPLVPALPSPEEALDGAGRFMGGAEWLMRQLGLTDGADNLARYRSGGGAKRVWG